MGKWGVLRGLRDSLSKNGPGYTELGVRKEDVCDKEMLYILPGRSRTFYLEAHQ